MSTKRISEDYDSHLKDDLATEVAARGLHVPDGALKADLVSALEKDDRANARADKKAAESKDDHKDDHKDKPSKDGSKKASDPSSTGLRGIPKEGDPVKTTAQPSDVNLNPVAPGRTKVLGKFKRKADGEVYEVEIGTVSPIFERTHSAKNKDHVWEGTGSQFVDSFWNENGSEFSSKQREELSKSLP